MGYLVRCRGGGRVGRGDSALPPAGAARSTCWWGGDRFGAGGNARLSGRWNGIPIAEAVAAFESWWPRSRPVWAPVALLRGGTVLPGDPEIHEGDGIPVTSFHDAQLLDPFDPAPMLIYADWLDEHGDLAAATSLRGLALAGVPSLAAVALGAALIPSPDRPDAFDIDRAALGERVGDGFGLGVGSWFATTVRIGDGCGSGGRDQVVWGMDRIGERPAPGRGDGAGDGFRDGEGYGKNEQDRMERARLGFGRDEGCGCDLE